MMSDHPGLNFTSIEQLDVKVGESRPQPFDMCGKSFSADAGISIRTAKRSLFRESGDKRVGIATVPSFMVAASNFVVFIAAIWQVSCVVSSAHRRACRSYIVADIRRLR
jgi:hypothetical protein